MTVTDQTAATMLRLPIHGRMTEKQVDKVVDAITNVLCGDRSKTTDEALPSVPSDI
jgi:hypothetical protein